MAWDWVGSVSASAVGIAGIVGTYAGTRHQANVTVRLAREERVQARRERAYVEVQRVVELTMQWVVNTMPMMTLGEANPYPDPPPAEQVLEAAATQVYWSSEVRELVRTWTAACHAVATNSGLTKAGMKGHADGWSIAPELRAKAEAAADALLARMHGELSA